jgi:CBS domain-containing protein
MEKMSKSNVKNIMIPREKVIAVKYSTTISVASAIILKNKIGSIIVLDGEDYGIVTKSDLISNIPNK